MVHIQQGFSLPSQDLGELLARVGCKLFTRDHTFVQYLGWSDMAGLFDLIQRHKAVSVADVCSSSELNENGADALLGVLAALGLATRSADGRYSLTGAAREYFLPESPFYIGDQLASRSGPIPRAYASGRDGLICKIRLKLLSYLPGLRFGTPARLRNQHARNLSACAAAVRTGEFANVRCLVDIAGGSGPFSIPLALESKVKRIVLTELPQALPNVRPFLVESGVADRVELLGMDVFDCPWPVPECDGIFIGNFLHGFGDDTCRRVCREAFERLAPGGKIWIHEMLWNDNKDGPLITALCNAAMRSGGAGRQRTAQEIMAILGSAGFSDPYVRPTAGAFALIAGRKCV